MRPRRTIVALAVIAIRLVTGMAEGQEAKKDSTAYYVGRYVELYKDYVKEPDDVTTLLDMARFYFSENNPMRNVPQALKATRQAEKRYIALLEDNDSYSKINQLIRKGVTIQKIREQKQRIIDTIVEFLEASPTMNEAELESYLEAFGDEASLAKYTNQLRIEHAYQTTCGKNTLEDYYRFIQSYVGTQEAEEADKKIQPLASRLFTELKTEEEIEVIAGQYPMSGAIQRAAAKRKSELAYEEAGRVGTIAAYKAYLSRYSSGKDNIVVLNKIDSLIAIEYEHLSSAEEYAMFAKENTDNPLADKALAALREMVVQEHNPTAAKIYLEQFPLAPHYDDVYRIYYSWYAEEGDRAPIEQFRKAHPDYPYPTEVTKDLEQSRPLDGIDLTQIYVEKDYGQYSSLVRKMTGKKISFVVLQRLLQKMTSGMNWAEADKRMKEFEISFEDKYRHEYEQLAHILRTATGIEPHPVLTSTTDITHPVISPNGSDLYYNSGNRICSAIPVSTNSGKWMTGEAVIFAGTENRGITIYSLYDEGTKMLLGKNGNICIAERANGRWRMVETLPYPINTEYQETDAYMLPDGTGILFASDRPGGYNIQTSGSRYHGDTALASDLYYSAKTAEGWTIPVNLGRNINTEYCERSPLISSDLSTLFFVSDGHGGMGYGDIYVAKRQNNNDWTMWSEPENLGREVNSGFDEGSIAFGPREKEIYYSKKANGHPYGCYSFVLPNHIVIETRKEANDTLHSIWDNPFGDLTPEGLSEEDLTKRDKPIELPRVLFKKALDDIEYLGENEELNKLAHYMYLHPNMGIEIISTDHGTDDSIAYERTLSRVYSIKQYMVSRKVKENRIEVSAYGNADKYGIKATSGIAIRLKKK